MNQRTILGSIKIIGLWLFCINFFHDVNFLSHKEDFQHIVGFHDDWVHPLNVISAPIGVISNILLPWKEQLGHSAVWICTVCNKKKITICQNDNTRSPTRRYQRHPNSNLWCQCQHLTTNILLATQLAQSFYNTRYYQ